MNETTSYAPVSEGGDVLNINQGADAIGSLGLFDENQAPAVEETPPDPTTSPDQPVESDPTEAPESESDTETGEDTQPESEEDAGSEKESETDTKEEETQAPIETLSQLVDALEADDGFLAGLTDTFKADGKEVTVSLSELRRGYQRDANYRRQTQDLAESRRAHEEEHATAIKEVQREMAQVGQVLQQGEATLVGELNTPEMAELRQTNPAEWAARREELGQRIAKVKELFNTVAVQYDAYHTKEAEEQSRQLAEMRQRESDNLMIALPEWGDELKGKVMSYLGDSYGYTSEDLNQVYDSRIVVLANKARLYDEMQKVGKASKKKIVNLPKTQKPGTSGQPAPSKETINLSKAKKRLASSGNVRDAAELIGLISNGD